MNKITKFINEQIYLLFYIIVIGIGLIFSVLILAKTVDKVPAINTTGPSNITNSLHQSTIDKLNELRPSDEVSEPPTLPETRINPFSE